MSGLDLSSLPRGFSPSHKRTSVPDRESVDQIPRAIDLILNAIIGYGLNGSPRGAEGRGAPETKWSLLFPVSYNNQSTCAMIIDARYDHSPDSFSKEVHT